MSVQILFFLLFTSIGFSLALFLFFKRKGDQYAHRILGFYTLFFAAEMLHGCLKWSGLLSTPYFTHFTLINALLWTSYGPLVYLYVKRIVTNQKLEFKDSWIFVFTLIIGVLHAPFYLKSTSDKIAIIQNGSMYEYAIFPSYAIWVVILIMSFFSVFTIIKFKDNGKFGYRESVWFYWFIGSYIGFVFFFFLYVFLVRLGWLNPKYDYLIDLVITIFIVALTYFGIMQPQVFDAKRSIHSFLPFVKYRNTGLSELVSLELKERLEFLMRSEKLYLNQDLRLNDIAQTLRISRNHASQLINENYNLSFFDYINRHRIEEAKSMLLNSNDTQLNVSQIAYNSGFNSRASFYKAFKKFTNVTPSMYIDQNSFVS